MFSDKIVNLKLFADDYERYEAFCEANNVSLLDGLPLMLDWLDIPSTEGIRADMLAENEERKNFEEKRKKPEYIADLKRRAEAGDSFAQSELAEFYYSGRGVPQDYAQAFFWAEKASAEGVGLADALLGVMYYRGYGVELDIEKAHELFCSLAETGESIYQDFAGSSSLMLKTEGGEKMSNRDDPNNQEAVSWFTKAAEQRDGFGELMLGLCYLRGIGVEKDAEYGRILISRSRIRGEKIPEEFEEFLKEILEKEG